MTSSFEDHCWRDVVDPEVLEIYETYARETYVGRNPALLAIDLYNLVYEGGPGRVVDLVKEHPSACGDHAWKAIAPTVRLFAAARAAGLPVIYSTHDPKRRKVNQGRVRATKRQRNLIREDAFEIKNEFKPEPDDLIIYKERASVMYGTALLAHLVSMGVDSLIVCGESTSGCVRATVVDAYSNGFHVTMAEECCFDRSMLSHKVNLFDLHHKYADVIHVDEIVAELESRIPVRKAV